MEMGKKNRFHNLRYTFTTLSLKNGIDVKSLSPMLGHLSAATTPDIYTHITEDIQVEAAAKIDRRPGDEVQEDTSQPEQARTTDFHPVLGRIKKPGTGCIVHTFCLLCEIIISHI